VAEILIVDDDAQLRQSFERLLAAEGHVVHTASCGEDGLEHVRRNAPDLVIMDVRMPGIDGLEAFRQMHALLPHMPVIVMTAYGTTDTAIEATKRGAFDFVLKPFDIPEILAQINKALISGQRASIQGQQKPLVEDETQDTLLGRSPAIQEVCKSIGRVAPTDATVLIRGDSGTGKELVARALHRHSNRSKQPFLVINCVAIPETLLESELFGYEKGAFTGASSRRVGRIELANRGTVFLDEIGDMPANIQAKILRLLQERQIERLGGSKPIPVDVRILAATNRDLEAAVSQGAFREDLYYRLSVVTLTLPPLRDRREDIPILAEYFCKRHATDLRMDPPEITTEGMALLREYDWPGNIRELANTLMRAVIFSRGLALGLEELTKVMTSGSPSPQHDAAQLEETLRVWIQSELATNASGDLFENLISQFGAMLLKEALQLTNGNRTQAAKLLGLSRPTLLARIEKYGLKIGASIS
jgi:nitrogen regulation protein NR(I)